MLEYSDDSPDVGQFTYCLGLDVRNRYQVSLFPDGDTTSIHISLLALGDVSDVIRQMAARLSKLTLSRSCHLLSVTQRVQILQYVRELGLDVLGSHCLLSLELSVYFVLEVWSDCTRKRCIGLKYCFLDFGEPLVASLCASREYTCIKQVVAGYVEYLDPRERVNQRLHSNHLILI